MPVRYEPLGRPFRAHLIRGLVLALIVLPGAARADKSYRYEDDPVRLGMKALEDNNLDEARKQFNESIANDHMVYEAHYGLAEILVRQGSFADAEPLYRQALSEKEKTGHPEFPEAHAGLGLILLRLQRSAEARQEFTQALNEKGGLWEAQYGMARCLIEDKKYDDAAKLLDKGSHNKGFAEREDYYQYGMALVNLAKNDVAAAEKNAMAAFNIYPNDPDYGNLVAEIETKRGALSIATDIYEKVLATPGLMVAAPIHERLGVLYEEQKRYNEALAQYKEAVKIDSTYADGWKSLGDLYVRANRYEEAVGAYVRYTPLRRDDATGYLGLAESCLKTNRAKTAYDAAEQAFKLDSTKVAIRLALARAAFMNRNPKRAAQLYDALPDTTHFEAVDYVRMGQLRLDSNPEVANRDLERAVKMDSTQADAYFALGIIDLHAGRPDSAIIHFDRATTLAPTSSGAWLNKGIAWLQVKPAPDKEKAIASLRQAARLAPDFVQGRLYLAQTLLGADSTVAAIKEYKGVLDQDPKNAGALRGLGLCYFKRKDYGQAMSTFRQATDADPGNSDGWAYLGQALAVQSNFPEATTALTKSLSINPNNEFAKKILEAIKGAKKPSGGK